MGLQILLDKINGKKAAALINDGQLIDFLVENDLPGPGTIFLAKANRVVKNLGGVFVSLPEGQGFLKRTKKIALGEECLVQVHGYSTIGKAIPVTSKLILKSRYVIVTPHNPGINISRSIKNSKIRTNILKKVIASLQGCDFGIVLRTNCELADTEVILEDVHVVLERTKKVLRHRESGPRLILASETPHQLAWRDWPIRARVISHAGCFEENNLLDQLLTICAPEVKRETGTYYIEATQALTAIDVNTGGHMSPAAALKANIAMAHDLPRQLRIRGIGGQIVIDPAPIPKKDRRLFEIAIRRAFSGDDIRTQILGWTNLGHLELQRARKKAPLELKDLSNSAKEVPS